MRVFGFDVPVWSNTRARRRRVDVRAAFEHNVRYEALEHRRLLAYLSILNPQNIQSNTDPDATSSPGTAPNITFPYVDAESTISASGSEFDLDSGVVARNDNGAYDYPVPPRVDEVSADAVSATVSFQLMPNAWDIMGEPYSVTLATSFDEGGELSFDSDPNGYDPGFDDFSSSVSASASYFYD